MEWVIPQVEIESELARIERSFDNRLVSYDKAISYCQWHLETYRNSVVSHGFPDEISEIRFFKKEKPFLFGMLQKYTHQLDFELDYPSFGRDETIIKGRMKKVSLFLSAHRDVILYLELGHGHLDPQYFLRKNRNSTSLHGPMGFSFDPGYSTSHDGLLAYIFGYQRFYAYLEKQLETFSSSRHAITTAPKLAWTSSKTALTELGFALYYSGAVGHGNTGLKPIMQFLEHASGLDLGDYHHTSIRLRNRSNPTKFLDRLLDSLKKWMEDLDD